MKKLCFLFLAAVAAVSCIEKETEPEIEEVEPFDRDRIDLMFVGDTVEMRVADGRKIVSVDCSEDWITARYDEDSVLVLCARANMEFAHRDGTLEIGFNFGDPFSMQLSQNARPNLEISSIDWWPSADPQVGATHISLTVALGEDVSDMRLLLTNDCIGDMSDWDSLQECIAEMISCGSKYGRVYTWEDYVGIVEEQGIFTMPFPDRYGNLYGLALDEEGNYDFCCYASWM